MFARRARFVWHSGPAGVLPPAELGAWLNLDEKTLGRPVVALWPDQGSAWGDLPAPKHGTHGASALVTRRPDAGTATRAAGFGADDVLVVDDAPTLLEARLRRLADLAVLRRELDRRRHVALEFATPCGPGTEPSPQRPAILFVGSAGGDQLRAVNALSGWSIAAYAETAEQACRHLAAATYATIVVSGVAQEPELQQCIAGLAACRPNVAPSLVVMRPRDATFDASTAIALGADEVIEAGSPQDLVHQRLSRATLEAGLRARLRRHEDFASGRDPVSGALGHSAFHAYLGSRLVEDRPRSGALLAVELDGLDELNLRHGFVTGDAALAAVVHSLAENLRAEDLIGRLGGAAHGVWIDQIEDETLPLLARRLEEAVHATQVRGSSEALTARLGWARPMPGTNVLALGRSARAQARRTALRAVS
ncbi:MAG: GGDEF domain-containing protein [Pseudomonadota bacterium]